jgi:hypothetical protein
VHLTVVSALITEQAQGLGDYPECSSEGQNRDFLQAVAKWTLSMYCFQVSKDNVAQGEKRK